MARIKLRIPDKDLSCHTFGSPAVMAHSDKEGSEKVCEIVGLKPSTIQHFCLDDDPVPRILLAVDPAYSLVRRATVHMQAVAKRFVVARLTYILLILILSLTCVFW
jgi:hypothetical protein